MAQRAPIQAVRRNRIPPHNLDAEQSVLGAMLESKDAIANVIEILKPDDFYKPAHVEIYESIMALHTRSEGPDAITLAEELARRGTLDQVGGKPYIHGLLEAYPTAGAAAHYARIIEENALLRRLVDAGNQVQELGFSLPEDVAEAIDQAEELIYDVGQRRLRDDYSHIKPLLTGSMVLIEQLYERGESITGVASGFPQLDDMTSGFQPSNLIIVAARPSMGKSSLLNDFALHSAMKQRKPSIIFSLEMSKEEVVKRFLSSDARVDSQRLNKGSLQEQDWTKLSASLGRLAEAPIFIDDSANITLMEMRAKCRRLKAKHDLGLVIIDYLQLMQSPRKSENRQQEVSEISRSLKVMARELNVPVICASQLNRGVEYRADKRPFLGDLRESGCFTADTRVMRADTGESVTMGELFQSQERNIPVWTLDEDLKLVRGHMTHVFSSGVKTVYRLRLRSGREVKASSNHPFFTYDGWRRLDEMSAGDRIAVAREVARPSRKMEWSDDHIILLAHMIGDGSCLRGLPTRYASMSLENLQAVSDSAKAFGVTARVQFEPAARSFQLFMPSPYRVTHGRRNPIVAWLDELGVYDRRAHEKFVPSPIFSLSDEQVGLFLRHLWATDGYIGLRKSNKGQEIPTVFYASSSRRLAEDVASLLLRFGIVARIVVTGKKGYADMYNVHIGSGEQLSRFVSRVGSFGPKDNGLKQILHYLSTHQPKVHLDTIPPDVWHRVSALMGSRALAAVERESGVKFRSQMEKGTSTSRGLIGQLGSYFQDEQLMTASRSDVYWDEVIGIERQGDEEVFDATVWGSHNYLANGIIAKNSIEQDSDLVMFIYRDEVYNPDSEARGEAEIIIAKHRNGPTGVVRLSFMNQYTKFASMPVGPAF